MLWTVMRRLGLMAAVVVAGIALLLWTSGSMEAGGEGERWYYDAGLQWSGGVGAGSWPLALTIDYFSSDTNPVHWAAGDVPVEICTHQHNRPEGISAEFFRSTVAESAQMWSDAGAAVGYHYIGDCPGGERWASDNGVNEIGFDDEREIVQPPAAAVIMGTWLMLPDRSEFLEIDIVIKAGLDVPPQCFVSLVAHELGHGLGFGHSDNPADLMYPSFDTLDLGTCPTEASGAERAWLANLYGPNEPPVVETPPAQTVAAGQAATLAVSASDPGGGPLSYEWTQTSGPEVAFTADGASLSFVAPDSEAELSFRVDVFDRYRARTSAAVAAVVEGEVEPVENGTLGGVLPASGGVGLATWSGGPVESLVGAAIEQGCLLRSLWVTPDGQMVGYTVGAPAFVNQVWLALYPGDLPELFFLGVCART